MNKYPHCLHIVLCVAGKHSVVIMVQSCFKERNALVLSFNPAVYEEEYVVGISHCETWLFFFWLLYSTLGATNSLYNTITKESHETGLCVFYHTVILDYTKKVD